MLQFAKDGDLAVDLRKSSVVARQTLFSYQFDGNLDRRILLPPHLDLAKLAFANGLAEDIVTKLDLFPVGGGVLQVFLPASWYRGGLCGFQRQACHLGDRVVGEGFSLARFFSGSISLWVVHYNAIDDRAVLAGQVSSHGQLTH